MKPGFICIDQPMKVYLAGDRSVVLCYDEKSDVLMALYAGFLGDTPCIKAKKIKDKLAKNVWKRKLGLLTEEQENELEAKLVSRENRRELLRTLMVEFVDEFEDLVKQENRKKAIDTILTYRNQRRNVAELINTVASALVTEALNNDGVVKDLLPDRDVEIEGEDTFDLEN